MAQAKEGDTVKVHYTGKLEDGTVFDTSNDREPLEFTIGEGHVIPGFEEAVVGMDLNESKTAKVTAENAYGPHLAERVLDVERGHLPPDLEVRVGQHLQISQAGGRSLVVTVTDVTESNVTLDANHPLAGQDLTFDIQLLDIV